MPRFDLNGDPLPDDQPAQPGPAAPQGQPYQPAPQNQQQYQQPPPQYAAGPPVLPQAPRGTPVNAGKIVIGIVVLTLVIGIAGWTIAQLNPPAVPAPSGYQSQTIPELGILVDEPSGWQTLPIDKTQSSDEVKITGGAVFKSHTAMIEIAEGTSIDPTASGAEGIAQLSNSQSNSPADMAAMRYRRLASAHLWGYHTVNQNFYSENEKAFRFFKQETYEADRPLWGIGGPIKGYFVTEANHDQCVVVVCECRKSDWKALQPAFDHVIDSIDSTMITKDPVTTPSSPSIQQIPSMTTVIGGSGM